MACLSRVWVVLCLTAAIPIAGSGQAPAGSPGGGPTFDVVSIKRNLAPLGPAANPTEFQRPDGGFTMTNTPLIRLIAMAYPGASANVGLPPWATSDRYDFRATSSLTRATADDRIAMLRVMLADRFKLVLHIETREQPVYDLVLARSDGRLGSGITLLDVDCARIEAERVAAAAAARDAGTPAPSRPRQDLTVPPPPCTARTIDAGIRDIDGDHQGRLGGVFDGEGTLDMLAMALRLSVDRPIVNKTGLAGSYRMKMNFDFQMGGPRLRTDAPAADAPPSVFTAVQEQLGLKLESSKDLSETRVIDHIERPTEN